MARAEEVADEDLKFCETNADNNNKLWPEESIFHAYMLQSEGNEGWFEVWVTLQGRQQQT